MSTDSENPRWTAYWRAHGASSGEEMLERDSRRFPGGKMAGFMIWIRKMWRSWEAETGWRGVVKSGTDHLAFDAWLQRRVNDTKEGD